MESNRMNRRVYLDHNASTPVHPEVLAEMLPYFAEIFGNPSSIHAFGRVAREHADPLHVDAVQTFGKIPLDVDALGIDALSFSSHKIYGPKGVAGLYIRKGTRMVAVQHGGDHERRRRAGTENVAAVVGLGKAVEVRARDMHAEAERLTTLRNRLIDGVHGRVSEVRLSGHPVERLPGTASFLFRHV